NRRSLKFSSDAGLYDLRFGELEQIQLGSEPDASRIRPCLARYDIHHRCLTGSVGADDAKQLSGVHVERQLIQRLEAIETDRHLLDIQNLVAYSHLFLAHFGTRPTIPHGRKSVPRINKVPSA